MRSGTVCAAVSSPAALEFPTGFRVRPGFLFRTWEDGCVHGGDRLSKDGKCAVPCSPVQADVCGCGALCGAVQMNFRARLRPALTCARICEVQILQEISPIGTCAFACRSWHGSGLPWFAANLADARMMIPDSHLPPIAFAEHRAIRAIQSPMRTLTCGRRRYVHS